jgi:hypothetical protein
VARDASIKTPYHAIVLKAEDENIKRSHAQHSEEKVMEEKYMELPLSPLEKALIDEQEIIFYLPSDKDSYRKSVDRSIQLGVAVLQEYGFSIKEPRYQCIVGDTSKNNGETNEEGKIVFHYSGSLCRG